ncbi:MAG: S1 family peptidase, partial [Candidatus Acidiferrales bacterium]
EPITRGLGFFIASGSIVTAFQVIDGASSLRLDFADGSSAKVADVAAWNRAQDWAILRVDSPNEKPLEQAAPDSWRVGDLCYVLTSEGQNSRTIQTVTITGMEGKASASQRLTISALGPQGWLGAPLLDRYGRVIGLLSGGLQGSGSRRMGAWINYVNSDQMGADLNPTVLPLSALPRAAISEQPTTFAQLAAQGALITPLVVNPQAAIGVLCVDFRNFQGQTIVPVQPGANLSRARGHFGVVITWGPNEKVRSFAQLRIYDLQNHAVLQTTPLKIKLEPRATTYSAWKIPTNSLQPGLYRIDLLLGDQPQWRTFFRLLD